MKQFFVSNAKMVVEDLTESSPESHKLWCSQQKANNTYRRNLQPFDNVSFAAAVAAGLKIKVSRDGVMAQEPVVSMEFLAFFSYKASHFIGMYSILSWPVHR